MFKYNDWAEDDNWETPIEYWYLINKWLPKDITINDPFYFNGKAEYYWGLLGRKCIHKNVDFFTN